MTPLEYWRDGHGLGNITPAGNDQPETEEFLKELQNVCFGQDVMEFGCGVGRLAPFFSKKHYLGVDISPAAIEIAKKTHHGYKFEVDANDFNLVTISPFTYGHVAIAHTVLLHIPDDLIQATVDRFRQRRVIVSEILGRNWRRDGNPPVFNREIHEYDEIFLQAGYRMHRSKWFEYPHYPDTDIAMTEYHRK